MTYNVLPACTLLTSFQHLTIGGSGDHRYFDMQDEHADLIRRRWRFIVIVIVVARRRHRRCHHRHVIARPLSSMIVNYIGSVVK